MRIRAVRRSRSRWLGLGVASLLLPIGVAHLAQNSVATSYISESAANVSITSAVTVKDAHVNVAQTAGKGYYRFTDMMATLADGGHGIDGKTVVFTVSGIVLCAVKTTGGGHATCETKVAVDQFPKPLPSTFTATFAGDPPLEASHAEGSLTVTGDGNSSLDGGKSAG